MFEALKQSWRDFKRSRPGKRFQDRYERNREARSGRSTWTRFLKPLAAVLLIAAGILFCIIPGPGLPLLVIGAGLLADVSRRIAVVLDWLELRARALITACLRWWSRASIAAKTAAVISLATLATGLAYGIFPIITGPS
ncbi:hypothetical protein OKA05_27385 [Luteolibacter arcticus]|uniref:Transmembrane protein (PGPGW) n=1 Tax=Luteolibacter arcticus TaxID=1581411 RepID=A0ABT3GS03_9BACT|nr:hypothetical protein [Luteolibacter arcticus]MCW1926308.1 hypothetical protein [Luteolibacter arcticus]